MPDPGVPAPRPLTAEELAKFKQTTLHTFQVVYRDMQLRLVATVDQLQAEVFRLTAELAATSRTLDECMATLETETAKLRAALAATRRQRDAAYAAIHRMDRERNATGLREPTNLVVDEPTLIDLVHQLHTAIYGSSWARPESPKHVWEALLGRVRQLSADHLPRPGIPTMCLLDHKHTAACPTAPDEVAVLDATRDNPDQGPA